MPQGLVEPARVPEHCPALSKYSVVAFPKGIQNCVEVGLAFGVARKSATTPAMMLVAAVWDVALRFVCMPTGIMPITAIKQNAAIPRARVSSTSEKAATEGSRRSHLIDLNISAEAR